MVVKAYDMAAEFLKEATAAAVASRKKINSNPMLTEPCIANCQMFVDRDAMVRALIAPDSIGAEVGVWDGDFSEVLLSLRPLELHLIDIAIRHRVRSRLEPWLYEYGIAPALHEDDSVAVLNRFPDQSLDWIYIDGDHSLHGVSRDAEVAVRKIKRDGLLIFNDYKMGDHNVPEGFYPYGVIPVVNDLCLNHGFEMVAFAFHHQMYCDVAIRRR